jgi:hypothetical protein
MASLLLIGGTLLALVVVEAGFRLAGLLSRRERAREDRPEFYYSHELAPTLKDHPYQVPKPAGTFRIAAVGDSFTFGPYLQLDDTYPKRLERMLNLNAVQPRVEVINYGVPRYSTTHEVGVVKRAIREGADRILLQITLNDPEIKPYRPTGLIQGSVNRFGQVEFKGGIFRHWKSAAFVVSRLYNARSRRGYRDYHLKLFESRKPWESFTGAVGEIQELCRTADIPLVGVIFPLFGLPLDEDYPFLPIHRKVSALLGEKGIPVLDLLPAYRGIPVARLQMMPGKEFHPNEIANRLAAEAIYTFLEAENLIPPEARIKLRFRERIDAKRENAVPYP